MTNEEIILTIQHEIQLAQQPLLARIDVLEQEVDEALDTICSLNVLVGTAMMHVPVASLGSVSSMLHNQYNALPEQQRIQKPAGKLFYWAKRFQRLSAVWNQDSDDIDQVQNRAE